MKKTQIQFIKSRMESMRLSQSALAEKCGLTSMTIHRLLSDEKQNPTQKTIQAIADALGVSAEEIMQGTEINTTQQKINGYIEYYGEITKIDTVKQLDSLYKRIKYDEGINKLVREIKAQEKENKKSQSKVLDITTIDLFKNENYDTKLINTHSFRSNDDIVKDRKNDLGNMATRYGFNLFNEHFHNSESAYICGLFSYNSPKCIEIQRELQASDNAYEAKKSIRGGYEKRAKETVRTDWNTFNVEWMKLCVWAKCKGNEDFRKMLLAIPQNALIVENSTYQKPKGGEDKAAFWGARNKELELKRDIIERSVILASGKIGKKELDKKINIARNSIHNFGTWTGVNCMGKILTLCKHHLHNQTELPIDFDLLRSKQIYLFGKLLTFEQPKQLTVIFDFDNTLLDTKPLEKYLHILKGKERFSDEWKQAQKEFLSHIDECKLYEGMDEVIEYLRTHKNIKTCIVTAGIKGKVEAAIKHFGWKDIFYPNNIYGRHSFGIGKKVTKEDGNPMLFKKALKKMGIEAENCLSFGNEIDDTMAAKAVGIKAFNCLWGADDEEKAVMLDKMSDITLCTPKQIIEVISK